MAFGGGTWITQNKVLPGAYINVVSAGIASAALSDRGIATMPLELDCNRMIRFLRLLQRICRSIRKRYSDIVIPTIR